ncbi:nucleotide exchange factor GrpE [Candidatus Curtissbacteria bacterium RIFCSPLOWO2_02_FULL_40_13b]|uniref:Protein GrpE n=1 Tax=Candidatus Curtissbacteria bacterium RIFCSPLOWO2_02_FULL_40_13b TaxID=1797733 RepID=A0A1F5HUF1_9BACT|nr:MAG: nucleotide exchange factor GrpE [Candidatus Curtissbacteria bacterium RIFCSPLOWO2_02_FULL_40_13b]
MMKTKKATDETKRSIQHKDELARLEDQLKRALADYHNLEKRIEEERKLLSAMSSAIVIEKFLPVLDNLQNAQKHLKDEGLEIVIKQFRDILATERVEEVEAEGAQFDPNLHEATGVEQGENDNLVVRVVRKGYKINDKVLRPAQVVVSRKSVDQKAAAKGPLRSEASEPRSDDEREEKAAAFGEPRH